MLYKTEKSAEGDDQHHANHDCQFQCAVVTIFKCLHLVIREPTVDYHDHNLYKDEPEVSKLRLEGLHLNEAYDKEQVQTSLGAQQNEGVEGEGDTDNSGQE